MPEPAGTGPVEHEARQLVEAAARWLSAVPDSGAYAGRTVDEETDAEAAGGSGDAGPSAAGGPRADAAGEHLCRGCPWCRAKAAASGPVGADTLESLAHLLGAAAESLALFAQSRRGTTTDSSASSDEAPRDRGTAPAQDAEP